MRRKSTLFSINIQCKGNDSVCQSGIKRKGAKEKEITILFARVMLNAKAQSRKGRKELLRVKKSSDCIEDKNIVYILLFLELLMDENELSNKIIGGCIAVHKGLGGPGLLESVYKAALCHELSYLGLSVQRERPVQVIYRGVEIKDPLFLDIVVENKVIIEVKATEKHQPIFETQLLTYLRLTGLKLGLLINFGNSKVIDGVTRVVNGL